jgi:FkbM family methyltransferase
MKTPMWKYSILSALRRYLSLEYLPIEVVRQFDRSFQVLKGSIRLTDKDDAWSLALALRAKIVFDVGSNIGQNALSNLNAAGIQRYVLFEPNPLALAKAAWNLIHCGMCQKATFFCAFIGDQAEGETLLYTVESGAAGSMFPQAAKTASLRNSHMVVPSTTLDRACKTLELVPDYVKIDTEGAESLVLSGFVETAKISKIRILVEMHSHENLTMRDNAQSILNWCQLTNYRAWYLKNHEPLEQADLIAKRGRCHLLLQPASEEYPGFLKAIPECGSVAEVWQRRNES